MTTRTAYVDYQQRAKEFAAGDIVYPFGADAHVNGRVVAVWPAIGMVDVEWPHGNQRLPVEDLQKYVGNDFQPAAVEHNNVPGGAGTVSVPGGPSEPVYTDKTATRRVAEAFVKQALYWGSRDRKYKATKAEVEGNDFTCPKCRAAQLRKAIYKRSEGRSENLMGCPSCMFLIKRSDILGCGDPQVVVEAEVT